jgi:NADH-quinone oxidoreductase subunit A
MLGDYGFIGLFALVAIGMSILIVAIPVVLKMLKVAPHRPTAVKEDTYECGMKTIGSSWVQFKVSYYFYALLFIALDVLVVFLYPWAVAIKQVSLVGFGSMMFFIVLLFVGLIYAWKKKVLEWK